MSYNQFSELPQAPGKDEFVTVHIIMPKDKGRKVERALVIGTVPWSKRGLLNGTFDETTARMVLKMDVDQDRQDWNRYVAHLCKQATLIEGNSDEVVASAVEMILNLKEDGVDLDKKQVCCQTCLNPRDGLQDNFPKTATMLWKKNRDVPALVASAPCKACWETGIERMESIQETARNIAKLNPQEQIMGYRTMNESSWIIGLVGPSKVDAAIEKIKSEMKDTF